MISFQTRLLDSISKNEPIPEGYLDYFREKDKNKAFRLIMRVFEEKEAKGDFNKKKLAKLLGKEPSQITRWLSEPGNWTLQTMTDLMAAMGERMVYDHDAIGVLAEVKQDHLFVVEAIIPGLVAQTETPVLKIKGQKAQVALTPKYKLIFELNTSSQPRIETRA